MTLSVLLFLRIASPSNEIMKLGKLLTKLSRLRIIKSSRISTAGWTQSFRSAFGQSYKKLSKLKEYNQS